MNPAKVSFKGICRNFSHDNVPDGACEEIINMRYEKNAWTPIGKKKVMTSAEPSYELPARLASGIGPYDKVWGQDFDSGKVYVKHNTVSGLITIYKKYSTGWEYGNLKDYTSTATPVSVQIVEDNVDIKFFKNVIIIFDNNNNRIYYAIASDELGTSNSPPTKKIYYFAGNMELPEIDFTPTAVDVSTRRLIIDFTEFTKENYNPAWSSVLYKKQSELYALGEIEGSVSIICAYELFDGTYVYHSIPKNIQVGNLNGIFDNWINDLSIQPEANVGYKMYLWDYDTDKNTYVFELYKYGKIQLAFNIAYDINVLRGKYKDIIKNISVFMTKPQSSINLDDGWGVGSDPIPQPTKYYSTLGPNVKILEDLDYYRVATYNLDSTELTTPTTLNLGDMNDIATRKQLPVDNFSRVQLHSSKSLLYNSRLNLANINVRFPDVKNLWLLGNTYDASNSYWCEFEIHTGSGVFVVNSEAYNYRWNDVNASQGINPFPFPDSRCSRMRVIKKFGSSYFASKYYSMSPNNIHNFSYFADKSEYFNITDSEFLSISALGLPFQYIDNNRVQVSEVNNPFYFPAKLSYQVGSGDILGIIDNAMQVDTGQFGQYPMIVFAKNGNWAMNIGNGDPYIINIVPHSSRPMLPGSQPCKMEDFIIYQSKEGLEALSGRETKCLTKILESGYGNPLNVGTGTNYLKFLGEAALVGLSQIVGANFLGVYLADPYSILIGFDHNKREIIVSNHNYDYSYVFSLTSQYWHKITDSFLSFINCFGSWSGVRKTDGYIVDLATEDSLVSNPQHCLIQTAPVNFGSQVFKKLSRSILRCRIGVKTGCKSGFYLYRRQKDSWLLVDGNQIHETVSGTNTVNDSPIPKGSQSQEFIFIFASQLTGGFVTGIEAMLEAAYSSKLR